MRKPTFEQYMLATEAVSAMATGGDTPAGVVGVSRVTYPQAARPAAGVLRVDLADGSVFQVSLTAWPWP